MSALLDVQLSCVTITCCVSGCGISFAVPSWWEKKRRSDHTLWYCPNGHQQYFSAMSDEERARQDARVALDNLARERARHDQTKAALETTKRSRAAVLGASRRIRERAKNGVCPCCNRTFKDMARHMATKHPKFETEPKP